MYRNFYQLFLVEIQLNFQSAVSFCAILDKISHEEYFLCDLLVKLRNLVKVIKDLIDSLTRKPKYERIDEPNLERTGWLNSAEINSEITFEEASPSMKAMVDSLEAISLNFTVSFSVVIPIYAIAPLQYVLSSFTC